MTTFRINCRSFPAISNLEKSGGKLSSSGKSCIVHFWIYRNRSKAFPKFWLCAEHFFVTIEIFFKYSYFRLCFHNSCKRWINWGVFFFFFFNEILVQNKNEIIIFFTNSLLKIVYTRYIQNSWGKSWNLKPKSCFFPAESKTTMFFSVRI